MSDTEYTSDYVDDLSSTRGGVLDLLYERDQLLAENIASRIMIERLTRWGRLAEAVCDSEGIGPQLTLDEVLSGKDWDSSKDWGMP